MKKLLLAVALGVVAVSPVNAKTQPKKAVEKQANIEKLCSSVSKYAKVIMTGRQLSMPITGMIERAEQSDNKAVREVNKIVIMSAYERPLWATDEYKEREIAEFSNEQYMQCITALSD